MSKHGGLEILSAICSTLPELISTRTSPIPSIPDRPDLIWLMQPEHDIPCTARTALASVAMAAGAVGQTRWPAWSAYYIGRIEEASGQDQAARSSYERALSYSGEYDYRNALEKNVRVALERLSQNRSR